MTSYKDRKTNRPSKRIIGYSRYELNKLIDAALHPYGKHDPFLVLFDGLLHALLEQNPPESFLKFLRYNYPTLLKIIQEKRRAKK